MTIEDRITGSLHDGLARLDVSPGDLFAVQSHGVRMRRNRRLAIGGSVVAVVAVAGLLFAVRPDGNERVAPAEPGGTWQQVESAPISPRWDALSGWTGTEALFIGGGPGTPCPPNADCDFPDELAKDGAAYDPVTDTWRTIAEAPIPMGYYFRTTMVGDTMIVFGDGRWFAFDAGEDQWRTLPEPPEKTRDTGSISASDGKVYALSRAGVVQVLDVEQGTWTALPDSDLSPALTQRTVVAAGGLIVVSGLDATKPNDGHEPDFVIAEVWDGDAWTRLPATGQMSAYWHWTGLRLVDGDIQTADGGEVRGWGRTVPYGGRLDPSTGEWTALPNAPNPEQDQVEGWSVNAADGPLIAGWGYVYDDSDGSWTVLGHPHTTIDVDQSAVWADGRLIVFGGVDTETGYRDISGLSNDAWIWTP